MTVLLRALVFLALLAPLAACAARLDEAEVRRVAEAVEGAAQRRDVAGQAQHFADDIEIVSVSPDQNGSERVARYTKAEFVENETEANARHPEARYSSTIRRVETGVDGRSARVFVDVRQSAIFDGKPTVLTATQILDLEERGGRIVVVSAESRTESMEVDGVKIF